MLDLRPFGRHNTEAKARDWIHVHDLDFAVASTLCLPSNLIWEASLHATAQAPKLARRKTAARRGAASENQAKSKRLAIERKS